MTRMVNINTAQLKVVRSLDAWMGQKHQRNTDDEYIRLIPLISGPRRPRLHRAVGNSSGCFNRRYSTQAIEVTYVIMREESWRVTMALKAVVEPMLISESSTVIPEVTATALAGTWSFGWTYNLQTTDELEKCLTIGLGDQKVWWGSLHRGYWSSLNTIRWNMDSREKSIGKTAPRDHERMRKAGGK